jgi:hypothetical protein
VVSGKTRRITFVECGNDLNSMVDLGKVVDLVLLMIDGSFGFEMVRQDLTPTHVKTDELGSGNVRIPEHPSITWIP